MAVEHYRELIQKLLNEKIQRTASANSLTDKQLIFDPERDHYQLVHVGWKPNGYRNYGCVVHLDIIDGKIWVQHDGTDDGIAYQLAELGVPKQDIVLGFQPPSMRKYTEFAIS